MQNLGTNLHSAYNTLTNKDKFAPSLNVDYTLPDGTVVQIGPERFIAPEIMFNPSLAGLEFPGMHEFIQSSVERLDVDLRKTLLQNVVVSGGNT